MKFTFMMNFIFFTFVCSKSIIIWVIISMTRVLTLFLKLRRLFFFTVFLPSFWFFISFAVWKFRFWKENLELIFFVIIKVPPIVFITLQIYPLVSPISIISHQIYKLFSPISNIIHQICPLISLIYIIKLQFCLLVSPISAAKMI